MSKKLYEENHIRAIANAIRAKNGSTSSYTVGEMAAAIESIPSGGETIPLDVTMDGVYEAPEGVGYSPVNVNIAPGSTYGIWGSYTDKDGKFVKGEDWPDLAAYPLNDNEAWILYDRDLGNRLAFWRIYFSGTIRIERGHDNNGTFVVDKAYEGSFPNGSYLGCIFDDTMPKYPILHITASTQLQQLYSNSSITTSTIYNATKWLDNDPGTYSTTWVIPQTPVLWRRAKVPYGTAMNLLSYFVVCDELVDWHTKVTGNFSLASMYSADYALVKIHWPNHGMAKHITSLASTFNGCYSLSDINIDTVGLISNICTNLSSAFASCYCWPGEIDVTDWDTSKVTTIGSCWSNLRAIKRIKGIEDLKFPAVTTFSSCLYGLWNLTQNEDRVLDLSGWFETRTATSWPTSAASMFYDLRCIRVLNIDKFNFSNATTCSTLFGNAYNLKRIEGNFVPPSSKCTTALQVWQYCCSLLDLRLEGWDFSHCTGLYGTFCGIYSIPKLDLTVAQMPIVNSTTSSSTAYDYVFRYDYLLWYLDASNMDMKYNQTTHANLFGNCPNLRDLYPPKNLGYGNRAVTLSTSTALTRESLLRVIDSLATVTAATTLTLGAINLAKLTTEEQNVAKAKGWTLA